jgi:hypothetical protein
MNVKSWIVETLKMAGWFYVGASCFYTGRVMTMTLIEYFVA